MKRRRFLKTTTAAITGFVIVPRHVVAGAATTPPSEKLNIAGIGIGGQGGGVLRDMADENIVALCDVDWNKAAGTFGRFSARRSIRTIEFCWTKRPASML